MFKRLGRFAVLAVCLFAIAIVMVGCGPDEGDDDEFVISVTPADGSTITPSQTITIVFAYPLDDDHPLGGLGSTNRYEIEGNTVKIDGPFDPGSLELSFYVNFAENSVDVYSEDVDLLYTVEAVPLSKGMVLIPAGTFEMGNPNLSVRWVPEAPVHTVHLDAFYMDKYPVTNAEFKAFVDANWAWQKDNILEIYHDGDYLKSWTGNDYPAGEADYPVVYVSWYAAMAYAEWAGKRLPTEAEWEYAARGGVQYDDLSSVYPENSVIWWGTIRAGQYAANGYGLYDMAGNGAEWCLDEYDEDFYNVSDNSRNPIAGGDTVQWLRANPTSISSQRERVHRGSGIEYNAHYVVERDADPPRSTGHIGFRCVKDTP